MLAFDLFHRELHGLCKAFMSAFDMSIQFTPFGMTLATDRAGLGLFDFPFLFSAITLMLGLVEIVRPTDLISQGRLGGFLGTRGAERGGLSEMLPRRGD